MTTDGFYKSILTKHQLEWYTTVIFNAVQVFCSVVTFGSCMEFGDGPANSIIALAVLKNSLLELYPCSLTVAWAFGPCLAWLDSPRLDLFRAR